MDVAYGVRPTTLTVVWRVGLETQTTSSRASWLGWKTYAGVRSTYSPGRHARVRLPYSLDINEPSNSLQYFSPSFVYSNGWMSRRRTR